MSMRDISDALYGHATLIDELDKKVMVYLCDGRTLIGVLRSIDQFANLVLHKTIERIHVGKRYGDIYRGVFVVRGENVVVVGLIDTTRENAVDLEEVSVEQILEAQREQQQTEENLCKKRISVLGAAVEDRDYFADLL